MKGIKLNPGDVIQRAWLGTETWKLFPLEDEGQARSAAAKSWICLAQAGRVDEPIDKFVLNDAIKRREERAQYHYRVLVLDPATRLFHEVYRTHGLIDPTVRIPQEVIDSDLQDSEVERSRGNE